MSISYLFDEHLSPADAAQIRRRVPDLAVWTVGLPGAPPKGTRDPAVPRWCEAHECILVTNNRKSMPGHLSDHLAEGGHLPGIFVVNPGHAIGRIRDELALIAGASFEDEYRDRIVFLPFT